MKRWIIEYFNIFSERNKVAVFYARSANGAIKQFNHGKRAGGFVFPVMGIREDGSIGGG